MKKILFIVCTHGDELAGHKLFQDYPYGETDKVSWKVIIGNPEAVSLNTRYIESDLNRSFNSTHAHTYEEKRAQFLKRYFQDFDEVYDIHTTRSIHPSSWDDCVFVNTTQAEVLRTCSYLTARHIIWDSDEEYSKQYLTYHHPLAITLEYQKTYDVYNDYERILVDFENIIHQEKPRQENKVLYTAGRGITQDEQQKYQLELEDFRPLKAIEKKQLGLSANDVFVPVFVNSKDNDKDYYCFLNKKMKDIRS